MTETITPYEVAPIPPQDAMIGMLERAARDPEVNVEKMERLFALRERMLDQERVALFNAAMSAVQRRLPQILRDAKSETNKYARLETISRIITPIYTDEGLALSFGTDTCPVENFMRIVCDVSHRAGYTKRYQVDMPLDLTGLKGNPNKTPTHAHGSTMSYGRRYLTLLIFNLALANEDDDGGAGVQPRITDKQVADLEAMISELNVNKDAFLRYLKVESLDQIRAKSYQAAVAALESKRRHS